jgi:hypothetical protein
MASPDLDFRPGRAHVVELAEVARFGPALVMGARALVERAGRLREVLYLTDAGEAERAATELAALAERLGLVDAPPDE